MFDATENSVTPINEAQRAQVVAQTSATVQQAALIYKQPFSEIPVIFNAGGQIAGQYVVRQHKRLIRYNPYIFAKYFTQSLSNTVPHEVAHYIADILYGAGNIRPHGHEWRSIMRALNVNPVATYRYDLTGIPLRKQRRHTYSCLCGTHELTSRRHNLITGNKRSYMCRQCSVELRYQGV